MSALATCARRALAITLTSAGLLAQLEVEGPLARDTTWRDQVLVTGDVVVPEGMTLTILPGTDVRIATRDRRGDGWNTQLVELHVHGRLLVRGTAEAPVTFSPVDYEPAAAEIPVDRKYTWHGIALHNGDPEARSEVLFGRVFGARAALQIPNGDPLLADCTILDCGVGAEVGAAYRDDADHGVTPGRAQPEIVRSRFAGCHTGVFVETQGSPDIRRSVFFRCKVGVGGDRPGVSRPLREPGPVLQRCALFECRKGVIAPAIVRDSVFVRCAAALTMSAFHAPFATAIDHAATHHNLFHACDEIVVGEIALDVGGVQGDPGFVGPLVGLEGPGAPLPAGLALSPDAPARGRAADGGDLGPLGTAGRVLNGVVWSPRNAPIAYGLALPLGAKDQRVTAVPPEPGRTIGKQWWVAAPWAADGVLDLRATFGEQKAGWLAVPVEPTSGEVAVELNGDVASFELFDGRKSLWADTTRRRFGEKGIRHVLAADAAPAVLLLRVEGWGVQPRIGIALDGLRAAPRAEPAPVPLAITKGRLTKIRKVPYLEVSTNAPFNWTDAFAEDRVEVRDGNGKPLPGGTGLAFEFVDRDTLRIEVPETWSKPLTVVLSGLRAPDGSVYAAPEPFVVR